jgi:hypothetical protein
MLFAGMAVVMPVFLSAKKCVNVVVSVSRNVRLGFLADKKTACFPSRCILYEAIFLVSSKIRKQS